MALPTPPSNVAATAQSSSTVLITWDDVPDETGYRVERIDALSQDGVTPAVCLENEAEDDFLWVG